MVGKTWPSRKERLPGGVSRNTTGSRVSNVVRVTRIRARALSVIFPNIDLRYPESAFGISERPTFRIFGVFRGEYFL